MWPFPKILAHRGGGHLAPENTLAALEMGASLGYKAVEFDVMLSQDAVPILMHDEIQGRTVKGDRKISDIAAAELMAMDAGSWFSVEYQGARVPDLNAALRFCREHNIWMNIEIKPCPGYEKQTGVVVARYVKSFFQSECAAKESQFSQLPLLSSFSQEALVAAYQEAPELHFGVLMDTYEPTWRDRVLAVNALSLHINHKVLDAAIVKEILAEGVDVFCYTVNQLERAQLLEEWGVVAYCTDELKLFAKQLQA